MSGQKTSKHAQQKIKLRKLSSSDPEARDEGPRLLPLPDDAPAREHSMEANSRYMDLAETAMRRKQPAAARTKDLNRKNRTK